MFSLDQAGYCTIRLQFGQQRQLVGECRASSAAGIEARSQHCQVGPVTINLLRATTLASFRRSPRHIAEDRADLAVLWFVRRGSLILTDPAGERLINPGELGISLSRAPLLAECAVDADGLHEAFHVILDTDLLQATLGREPRIEAVWPASGGPLGMAASLLVDALENDGELQPASSKLLIETALLLMRQGLAEAPSPSGPQPPAQARLREIRRFIDLQLTNPHICRAMVAVRCGISQRYLATLLEREGTSFSELLWQGRLTRAREWLAAGEVTGVTIAETAYALGFKSAAHFTRKFQRAYGVTPSAFRNRSAETRANP